MNNIVTYLRRISGGSLLRRNISMTLGRQLSAALAQLLLVVIIARELGPEGNGHYAMAILLPTLLATFLNMGVGPATVYHIGNGQFTGRQAAWENTKLGVLVAAAATAVAIPILHIWGKSIFPGIPAELLYAGLVAFPLTLLLAYLSTILQGLEQFRAYNWSVLLPPYVTLAGTVISFYLLDGGTLELVIVFCAGQLIGLLAVMQFIRNLPPKEGVGAASISGARYRHATLTFGLKAHASNVLTFINYRADVFIINLLLNPAATGLYVLAVQLAERLWMPSQAANTVLFPRLSAMHGDPHARLKLAMKGFVTVAVITAVISLLAGLVLYWLIVPVFGEDYAAALPVFFCLLPGVIAAAGARVQANCIAAAGKPEWNMYLAFCMVALNVTGNFLFVPAYGIIGAAWVTSIAYTVDAFAKHMLVMKTGSDNLSVSQTALKGP